MNWCAGFVLVNWLAYVRLQRLQDERIVYFKAALKTKHQQTILSLSFKKWQSYRAWTHKVGDKAEFKALQKNMRCVHPCTTSNKDLFIHRFIGVGLQRYKLHACKISCRKSLMHATFVLLLLERWECHIMIACRLMEQVFSSWAAYSIVMVAKHSPTL